MNFLISAYGCEPNKGSEPGIGWQWSIQFAKFGDVYVITRQNNQSSIEEGLKKLPVSIASKMHFYYFDVDSLSKKLKKGDKNLYLYYKTWQKKVVSFAKKLTNEIKFDYCVALTFGSIWMPTYLFKLKIPFIWGPIGGGEAISRHYYKLIGLKSTITQIFRFLSIKLIRLNINANKCFKQAKRIIVRTNDTKNVIPKKYWNKTEVCLETSISIDEVLERNNTDRNIIRFIYTGRLIATKGLELAIRAFSKSHHLEKTEFVLIGGGPQKKELQKLANKLHVENNVVFYGKMNRNELLGQLADSDVFLFPSLKEGGTWALMEAMGAGLPAVCLDASGMSVITDNDTAIRIPVSDVNETITSFASAIDFFVENQDARKRMGQMARQRIINEFNWDKKGQFLEKVLLIHE